MSAGENFPGPTASIAELTTIFLHREFPGARIVVLTIFDGDIDIRRALEAGARGYLLKSTPPEELVNGIRQVHAGKKHVPAAVAACLAEHLSEEDLSEREAQVLQHLARGNRSRDIAERLFIAEETVKVHFRHVMEKLGANDRTHAFAIAARRGFIQVCCKKDSTVATPAPTPTVRPLAVFGRRVLRFTGNAGSRQGPSAEHASNRSFCVLILGIIGSYVMWTLPLVRGNINRILL
jgi:DNA-binding NarL/FixJ family response regulator